MRKQGNDYCRQREKVLADGIKEVASELRLIDATDLVAFIRTEQFGNIGALVSSSAELYFRPGTLRFGQSGDVPDLYAHFGIDADTIVGAALDLVT